MKISESAAPIQILEQQFKEVDRDLQERLSKLANESQEVNRSVDRLLETSKSIEK